MFTRRSFYHLRKLNHIIFSLGLKAFPSAYANGFPGKKLKIYGITGTDGKTTSSTLLYHVLKSAGYKVALISTVAAFIGDEEIDTGFHVTSPEPDQIHKLLKRCVDQGIEHVVLEVTSHGVFQFRVWGIDFEYTGLTNISNEHLDYFVDYLTYAGVKAKFLASAKKKAFINKDDQSFSLASSVLKTKGVKFEAYNQSIGVDVVSRAIKQRFPEEYNRWNAKLVWAMARQIGVKDEELAKAIKSFPGVRGRMELIPDQEGGRVIIVDFAHTPHALEEVLKAARKKTKGKVISVFGCAGLRDATKRPVMADIATRLADFAVFTAEDPRTEDLQLIFRQMKEGVKKPNHRKFVTQPDRKEAIRFALASAQKGDVVIVTGKGHERSMCFGTKETPWSDQEAIIELLQEAL